MDHSSTSNTKNRTKQNENGTIGKKKQEQNDWKKRNKNRMIEKKGTRTE